MINWLKKNKKKKTTFIEHSHRSISSNIFFILFALDGLPLEPWTETSVSEISAWAWVCIFPLVDMEWFTPEAPKRLMSWSPLYKHLSIIWNTQSDKEANKMVTTIFCLKSEPLLGSQPFIQGQNTKYSGCPPKRVFTVVVLKFSCFSHFFKFQDFFRCGISFFVWRFLDFSSIIGIRVLILSHFPHWKLVFTVVQFRDESMATL